MVSKDAINERVLRIADIMISTRESCRNIAKVSEVSKSTIHLDVTSRLYELDLEKYNKCREILDSHKYNKSYNKKKGC